METGLDPIAMSLARRIAEAEDDINAIKRLPTDIRMGPAFMDGFVRIGIRDQLVRELADHLVFMPCKGIDTTEYQKAIWRNRDVYAHKIALEVAYLCAKEATP